MVTRHLQPSRLRRMIYSILLVVLGWAPWVSASDLWMIVPIGPASNGLTKSDIKKIFMGRSNAINDVFVTPFNFKPQTEERETFLSKVIGMEESEYLGYWYVRRFSGQGAPPREAATREELTNLLKTTKNGLGYVLSDGQDLPTTPPGYTLRLLE